MKVAIVVLSVLLHFFTVATGPDDIVGIWLTENDESKIQIYKVGTGYFGKITWLKEPNDSSGRPKKDKNNPNATQRNNPAIGILILKNVHYKEGKWKGTIYGPKRGKEVDCVLKLKGNDVLEGTASYGLMSGSRVWRRVK